MNFDHDGYRQFTEASAWNLCKSLLGGECNVLFDVGSHDGTGIIEWDRFFSPREIHAFEPDGDVFIKLEGRASQLKSRLFANNCGIGSDEGVGSFSKMNQTGSSSFLSLNPQSPYCNGIGLSTIDKKEVAIDTLDSYVIRKGLNGIDFLKIDVQGYEKHVLSGGQSLMSKAKIKLIQIELIFRPLYNSLPLPHEIFGILESYGYRVLTMHSFWPSLGTRLFQCDVIFCHADLLGES